MLAMADSLSSVKKVLLGPFVRLPIEELTEEMVFNAKLSLQNSLVLGSIADFLHF
jgi:hypothetical protein